MNPTSRLALRLGAPGSESMRGSDALAPLQQRANPSIKGTCNSRLRLSSAAAHVKRYPS